MKKKILALALVVICLSSLAYGTLAYFTSKDVAHNVITSGGVDIELVEKTLENGKEKPFPKEGLTGIMPGTSASKIVSVTSVGPNTAWVRVKLVPSVTAADGKTPLKEDVLTWEIDEKWIDGKDGWYYYAEPVEAGKSTTKLIEEVAFDGAAMGNEYQGCKAKLAVFAEAVQYDNNGDKQGETVFDAAGWPTE